MYAILPAGFIDLLTIWLKSSLLYIFLCVNSNWQQIEHVVLS